MARPKLTDTPVDKKISIRGSLYAKVELLLFDPMRGRTRYGGWAELINELLTKWIEEQEKRDVE